MGDNLLEFPGGEKSKNGKENKDSREPESSSVSSRANVENLFRPRGLPSKKQPKSKSSSGSGDDLVQIMSGLLPSNMRISEISSPDEAFAPNSPKQKRLIDRIGQEKWDWITGYMGTSSASAWSQAKARENLTTCTSDEIIDRINNADLLKIQTNPAFFATALEVLFARDPVEPDDDINAD